jgi:hypothetical protein
MNRGQVRLHALFGKTRPAASVNGTDYWGSRKGMKRVQCYFKKEIQAFRVELEMRPRFLRYYRIKDPFDFHRLVQVLPGHHIYFGRFSEEKLVKRLRHMGFSERRRRNVLRMVAAMKGDLWPILNYLRQEVGLKNTRRLLESVPTNQVVLQALQEWAAKWPTLPRRLGETK